MNSFNTKFVCFFYNFQSLNAVDVVCLVTVHKSYILSSDLSIPYANAAAVGSLITRRTFRPDIWPASLVAYEFMFIFNTNTGFHYI